MKSYITYGIAILLVLITIGINFTRHSVPPELQGTIIALPLEASPIEREFFIDWPKPYVLVDEVTETFGREIWNHPQAIPQATLKEIATTPIWQGFLPNFLGYDLPKAPLFEKVSQGEFWRLFTPALLHSELFHLAFNLFWLIALGRVVEGKIGGFKYLLLTLILGIFANVAQYLMTSLRFLGYSGVIAGLFGFAYSQQKSGIFYPFPPSLYKAIFIFIFGVAALETLFLFSPIRFSLGIANTAHVAGILLGIFLGKIK